MRDKTASKMFRAKKKLDHALEAALAGTYLPLYTMVTFTRIPYAKAAKRAQIQDALVYASLFLIGMISLAAMLWLIAT
jgi:kynurenine 3-monooxygenase